MAQRAHGLRQSSPARDCAPARCRHGPPTPPESPRDALMSTLPRLAQRRLYAPLAGDAEGQRERERRGRSDRSSRPGAAKPLRPERGWSRRPVSGLRDARSLRAVRGRCPATGLRFRCSRAGMGTRRRAGTRSHEHAHRGELAKSFPLAGGRAIQAVQDVSFTQAAAQTLGIVGESVLRQVDARATRAAAHPADCWERALSGQAPDAPLRGGDAAPPADDLPGPVCRARSAHARRRAHHGIGTRAERERQAAKLLVTCGLGAGTARRYPLATKGAPSLAIVHDARGQAARPTRSEGNRNCLDPL